MKIKHYLEVTLLKFLKTKSIDQIHVIDLIDDIGICKGTFYKYYQDKYQLLISTFQNSYYNGISGGADSWEMFVTKCLDAFKNSPTVILNAFVSHDVNSLRRYHEGLMAKFFEESDDFYYNFAVTTFTQYATDIIISWLKNKCRESNEELIKRMQVVKPVFLAKTEIDK